MANEQNLKPIRSTSEAREKGRKGGIASGRARREKKTYKKLAQQMLEAQISDKKMLAELKKYGIEDTDIKAYTLLGLIKASANGSHYAFDRLMDLAGETSKQDDTDKVNNDMTTLAQLINNPMPNRHIEDFENE